MFFFFLHTHDVCEGNSSGDQQYGRLIMHSCHIERPEEIMIKTQIMPTYKLNGVYEWELDGVPEATFIKKIFVALTTSFTSTRDMEIINQNDVIFIKKKK